MPDISSSETTASQPNHTTINTIPLSPESLVNKSDSSACDLSAFDQLASRPSSTSSSNSVSSNKRSNKSSNHRGKLTSFIEFDDDDETSGSKLKGNSMSQDSNYGQELASVFNASCMTNSNDVQQTPTLPSGGVPSGRRETVLSSVSDDEEWNHFQAHRQQLQEQKLLQQQHQNSSKNSLDPGEILPFPNGLDQGSQGSLNNYLETSNCNTETNSIVGNGSLKDGHNKNAEPIQDRCESKRSQGSVSLQGSSIEEEDEEDEEEEGQVIENGENIEDDYPDDYIMDASSEVLYDRLQNMEQEQELLNNSLLALTSHFAQVQLRLRQIVDAKDLETDKKEALLKDLETFANRGIPELMVQMNGCGQLNGSNATSASALNKLERSISIETSLMEDDIFDDDQSVVTTATVPNGTPSSAGRHRTRSQSSVDSDITMATNTTTTAGHGRPRSTSTTGRRQSTFMVTEEKLVQQRNRQKELIGTLKDQLEDLERYAYETGDLNSLPSSMLLERQNAIIEQLKSKLPVLTIDEIDKLSPEELRKKVDHAVREVRLFSAQFFVNLCFLLRSLSILF